MHSLVRLGAHSEGRLLAGPQDPSTERSPHYPRSILGNNGWLIAHEGHMGGAGPLLRLRCPLVWLIRKKLPTFLKRHKGSSPDWCEVAACHEALEQPGCPIIATLHGPPFWFLGPRKRDHFWSRNLSSKTVSLSEPHVRFLSDA